MRKFTGGVATNRVGSRVTFTFYVEDNATEDDICEEACNAVMDMLDIDYEEDLDYVDQE